MEIVEKDVNVQDKMSAISFWNAMLDFYPICKWDVLDAFARNGQLTVENYCAAAGSVHAWELSGEHLHDLLKLTPNVSIGDSYALVDAMMKYFKGVPMYDMIVIDTPAGTHSDSNAELHVEHFDFMEKALPLLRRGGVMVLYVNMRPYNPNKVGFLGYDKYVEFDWDGWMTGRKKFYGKTVITEVEALTAYTKMLKKKGRKLLRVTIVPVSVAPPLTEAHCFRVALEIQ